MALIAALDPRMQSYIVKGRGGSIVIVEFAAGAQRNPQRAEVAGADAGSGTAAMHGKQAFGVPDGCGEDRSAAQRAHTVQQVVPHESILPQDDSSGVWWSDALVRGRPLVALQALDRLATMFISSPYSYRSAVTGSMREARRAGTKAASAATAANVPAAPA